ncbi:SDR family NAD(P)-dependent oxidoreductase [Endozoicomonas sp.]|uniref:SDR family NAD(P)-dependent oxidoreductase n=1 Tax=Endozoicomonas sp. TaxID=1892382 RepID=UPI0028846D28|nr:SDR family NAD(P)-dependent oxidoreductase [Endozoicomonas sp.]
MLLKPESVVLVTGASRGVGKGIALALAESGATIYVTGRSRQEGDSPLPGTVFATAEAINERGGKGVAVVCDHGDDVQVEQLFQRIQKESGRLDILVNNATAVPDELTQTGPFWEKSLSLLDILDVGMRSTYVASYYGARIMAEQKQGLIVHTSSFGGRCYMHGPAYGGGKAAVDKFAADMGVDLKPHNVACISLWLGLVLTERTQRVFDAEPEKYADLAATAESPEFGGRVIAALANSEGLMERTGRIQVAAELAAELAVQDVDGKQPPSHRAFLGGPAMPNPAVIE